MEAWCRQALPGASNATNTTLVLDAEVKHTLFAAPAHRIVAPDSLQDGVEEGPFRELAGALSEFEARARCDGDEVDTALFEAMNLVGEHGKAVGLGDGVVAGDVEFAKVLAGDSAVGADVDDVNSLLAQAVQVFDDLGDQPASDQGLAEAYLICDEKPQAGVGVVVEAENAYRRRRPLERTEGP